MAVVWHCQPTAGYRGAVCGHDDRHQDASYEVRGSHAGAAGMAGSSDIYGVLVQDLRPESASGIFGAGASAGGGSGNERDGAADLQQPAGCGGERSSGGDGGAGAGGIDAAVDGNPAGNEGSAGAGIAVCENTAGGAAMKRARKTICDFAMTAAATLREIFDEAAYARFLDRTGMVSSRDAYAAFRQEFEEAKVRRPKCC